MGTVSRREQSFSSRGRVATNAGLDGTIVGEDAMERQMNIVCMSHLRWDLVYQRPQHLLSRAARHGRVLYVEESMRVHGSSRLDVQTDISGVLVAVPQVDVDLSDDDSSRAQRRLLREAVAAYMPESYVLWFYTPMAIALAHELAAATVVYDCMDELSAFAGAPAELRERELELFRLADVVFTGGQTLYEAKRSQHRNVHAFPSSVDVAHFAQARTRAVEPIDQARIPHPRIGFFGVIDERMDYPLLRGVAEARPDWHMVLIGPTVKVDPASLPQGPNIHYLGRRPYTELPSYIAGWDVATLPFARNESTRFISPTKTPEYLAAGKPVVSTSIRDVVRPYGQLGLARIADDVSSFVDAIDESLHCDATETRRVADDFLSHLSWDETWLQMKRVIEAAAAERRVYHASLAHRRRSPLPERMPRTVNEEGARV
jgi:glycosyltransferase involved in cell wall biosynthesis